MPKGDRTMYDERFERWWRMTNGIDDGGRHYCDPGNLLLSSPKRAAAYAWQAALQLAVADCSASHNKRSRKPVRRASGVR